MMKSNRLPANYHKLNPRERFSLLTHAMARNDRSEIDALADTASMMRRSAIDYAFLLNAFFTLTSEYVADQLNRAARLCVFLLPSKEHLAVPTSIRLVAFSFLQHQAAWLEFSKRYDISLSFPDCAHPGTELTLRVAAEVARHLAFSPEQAQAHAAGNPRAKPKTVDQIIAHWRHRLKKLAFLPDAPDDYDDYSDDYTEHDYGPPAAGNGHEPNGDGHHPDIGRSV